MSLAETMMSIWVVALLVLCTYGGARTALSILQEAGDQQAAILTCDTILKETARSLSTGSEPLTPISNFRIAQSSREMFFVLVQEQKSGPRLDDISVTVQYLCGHAEHMVHFETMTHVHDSPQSASPPSAAVVEALGAR